MIGKFQKQILSAMAECDETSVKQLMAKLLTKSGRAVTPPQIYLAINRLENAGLVISRKSEPLPVPGGRSKKIFELTHAGLDFVYNAQRT